MSSGARRARSRRGAVGFQAGRGRWGGAARGRFVVGDVGLPLPGAERRWRSRARRAVGRGGAARWRSVGAYQRMVARSSAQRRASGAVWKRRRWGWGAVGLRGVERGRSSSDGRAVLGRSVVGVASRLPWRLLRGLTVFGVSACRRRRRARAAGRRRARSLRLLVRRGWGGRGGGRRSRSERRGRF